MTFNPTTQGSGVVFLHGVNTEIQQAFHALGRCWLSLVISHPKTPILNGFAYLLWAYFLTDSEFSCLASWPSHILCVAQPTCPRFLTYSGACQKVHMRCLRLILRPDVCQFSI